MCIEVLWFLIANWLSVEFAQTRAVRDVASKGVGGETLLRKSVLAAFEKHAPAAQHAKDYIGDHGLSEPGKVSFTPRS